MPTSLQVVEHLTGLRATRSRGGPGAAAPAPAGLQSALRSGEGGLDISCACVQMRV
jgi:hypothetical protein